MTRPDSPSWTLMLAGLRSVGKSSVVGALWGNADLAPTAERDCTQANTLIRAPEPGEASPRVLLSYLPRETALNFAVCGPAFHRLAELIAEHLGPFAPRLDEGSAEHRLRAAVSAARKLFAEQPRVAVLRESLTDDLAEIEQLLAFVDSPDYRAGQSIEARWEDRFEHIMGRRGPDGKIVDTGRLLALRHVELICAGRPASSMRLLDTPFVPAFYNARRAELALAAGRNAAALALLALPDPFEPEEWVRQLWKERPELSARTFVIFNQVDTVDATALFARSGFAEAFQDNCRALARLGIREENIFISCARQPFLEALQRDNPDQAARTGVAERIQRLRSVLARLAALAGPHRDSAFKRKFLAACAPDDCGIESLRRRLDECGQISNLKSAV